MSECLASGYGIESLLDGAFTRRVTPAPDRDGPKGRIKFGTESNGGFRHITISNIVFDRSGVLAFETVDGGPIEDIAVSNITMRDVSSSPIFIRPGRRMRAPAGMAVATARGIRSP